MEAKDSKVSAGQRIGDFIQTHRRTIFMGFAAVIVVLLGTITALLIRDVFHQRAIGSLEELRERYHSLRFDIFDEAEFDQSEALVLLADLGDFAARSSGFVAGSAWAMAGRLHSEMEQWQEAEAAWRAAASAAAATYLGPLSLFNAAMAAEEQGNIAGAIELLTQSVGHAQAFPAAARAQFSIGRLNESLNSPAAAIEAYRAVLASWPGTVWANLAQSRIVALETGG
ncbi:MAG: tetratricopeptide repeat protein [Spirochaetes bacterium]|nr:tetratricopeptide repeat protein [Spirochaetota bacterium]